jgi:hypothetical protein
MTCEAPATRTSGRVVLTLLSGRGRLSTAYWGFGVGGGVVFAVVVAIIGLVLMTRSVSHEGATVENPALQYFLSSAWWLFLAYQLFVAILVWKNAFNVGNPIWGWLARGIVIAAGGLLGARLVWTFS